MKLLKELFDIGATLEESKKDRTIVVQAVKPRGKHVNDVLRSKKGGRMKSPTDFDRNASKREARKAVMESDEDCCYFWYEVSWEVKNRSGEGPEAVDRNSRGVIKADSKEHAVSLVKKRYAKATDVRVGKASKADYDKEMND
jgi:hypothetical protein